MYAHYKYLFLYPHSLLAGKLGFKNFAAPNQFLHVFGREKKVEKVREKMEDRKWEIENRRENEGEN